jgi:hypothetical protein
MYLSIADPLSGLVEGIAFQTNPIPAPMNATVEDFSLYAHCQSFAVLNPVLRNFAFVSLSFNHNSKWASSLKDGKQRYRLQEQRTYRAEKETVRLIHLPESLTSELCSDGGGVYVQA